MGPNHGYEAFKRWKPPVRMGLHKKTLGSEKKKKSWKDLGLFLALCD